MHLQKKIGIKTKTISPYNHDSLKTERHIRVISEMIAKNVLVWDKWTHHLQTCTYAYNSFASLSLNWLSPFQLYYGRLQKALLETETNSQEGTSGSFKEYYVIYKRFAYFQKIFQDYRLQQLDMIHKDKPMTQYKLGDFVFLNFT